MAGWRGYFRDVLTLARGTRDNPLVVHGAPWRSGPVPCLFFFAQLIVAGLILQAAAYLVVAAQFSLYPFGSREFQSGVYNDIGVLGTVVYVTGGILGTPFWAALNLLVFSSRWNERDRIAEMLLTRLTNREMAFGSIFWGVVAGSLVPLGCLLGGSILIVRLFVHQLENRPDMEQVFGFSAVLFVGLLLLPTGVGLAVKAWFYLMRARWPIMLLWAPFAAAYYGATGFAWFAGMEFLDRTIGHPIDKWTMICWTLLVGIVAATAMVRSAGRFAPSLFVRAVDMDPYRSASVLANSGLRFYRRDLRAQVREQLRAFVPVPWLATLVLFVPIAATLIVLTGAATLHGGGTLSRADAHALVFLAAGAIATALLLWRERRARGKLALVGGALEVSILRRLLPVHAVFALVMFGSLLLSITPSVQRSPAFWLTFGGELLYQGAMMAVLILLHVSLIAWALRPGRWRRVRWATTTALPVLGWFLSLRILGSGRPGTKFWWAIEDSRIGPLLVIVAVVLVFRLPQSLQRLHDATTRRVQPGEVVWLEGDPR
ncbi:MAG: hypothetical protein KF858_04255 [Candidatus Sumerlaeia bacterium]|nr:hypothetical protein [Candidatus Sumerlaeia bacterium]